MLKTLIFVMMLITADMVTGIFVNCILNGEKFESAKLKKGFMEKGIELFIIATIWIGKQSDLAEIITTSHLDLFSLSIFALQEAISVYENLKKIQK